MELNELLDKIEDKIEELNEEGSVYIEHFKPAVGVFEDCEKDCDENGNWGFVNTKYRVTEEQALKEAKYGLINDHEWFKDFIDGEFQDEIAEYLATKLKERNKW